MKKIQRILEILQTNFGWVFCLMLAGITMALSPYIVEYLWPEEPSLVVTTYFQRGAMAVFFYFLGLGVCWLSYQIDFGGNDACSDSKEIKKCIEETPNGLGKMIAVFLPFFLQLLYFCFCLWVAANISRL